MTTLIVYETMYGRTRDVAQSVALGCESGGAVRTVEVSELVEGESGGALPGAVTLLVVGGPTHAFSMTRPNTRRDAARYGTPISRTGVREWLETLTLPAGLPVAAFGTKLDSPLSGSAARAIGQRLRKLGGRLVVPTKDFYVRGTTPVLLAGELDAARAWGAALVAQVAPGR
ncbi:MAG TPA: flavodoxin/nitric oxide synthase [Cellulomonas sp.]